MSFQQESIVRGDVVRAFVQKYTGLEAIQARVGRGGFTIDLQADLQRSFCVSDETYLTPKDRQAINEQVYPAAFGVILRRKDGHSLWFEPNDKKNEFIGFGKESTGSASSGNGLFRRASYDFGASQVSRGHTLDPRTFMMLFDHPVDEMLDEFARVITANDELSRHFSIHGNVAGDCTKLRITIAAPNSTAWYVLSVDAAGNMIESQQLYDAEKPGRPVIMTKSQASFESHDGVIVPRTYSRTYVDASGKIVFTRSDQIQTTAVNKPVAPDEFTWKAFKPRHGQLVYDATTGKQLIFDRDLALIEYSPELHKFDGSLRKPRFYWVIIGNGVVGVTLLVVVLLRRRKGDAK
jgi:hypothetical protein